MPRLGVADYRAALDLVTEGNASADPAEFEDVVLDGLGRLVPTDVVMFSELSPSREEWRYATGPPDAVVEQAAEGFYTWFDQHPVIAHHLRTGEARALKVSDFVGAREWAGRELYNDCFRMMGTKHELAVRLPDPSGRSIWLSLHGRRGLSERYRELLDALRPGMAGAYAHAEDRALTHSRLALLERGLDEARTGIVLIDGDDRIVAASARARALLARCFDASGAGWRLPASLADWVTVQRRDATDLGGRSRSLELAVRGARLIARFIRGPVTGEDLLLLAAHRREDPSPELLARRLPLTRREAETLARIARGRTNAQVAVDLEISPRTVQKHLERIHAKLGVQTRGAAAARAIEAIGEAS